MKRLLALAVAVPVATIALTALAVLAEPGSIFEQLDGCDTDWKEAS